MKTMRGVCAMSAVLLAACGGAGTQGATTSGRESGDVQWVAYAPEGEAFSIDLPGTPNVFERDTANGHAHFALVEASQEEAYLLIYQDNSVDAVASTDRESLYRSSAEGGAAGGNCTITDMTTVTLGGFDARDVAYRCGENAGRSRVVIAGNRFIVAMMMGPRASVDGEVSERFINSLRVGTPPVAPTPGPWQTVANEADHARFEMPAGDVANAEMEHDENVQSMHSWVIESREGRFVLNTIRFEYPADGNETPAQAARANCDAIFEAASHEEGKTATRVADVDGWPAFDSAGPMQNGFVGVTRWVCVNNAAYALVAATLDAQRGSEVVTHYHQSFHADAPVAPRPATRRGGGRRR